MGKSMLALPRAVSLGAVCLFSLDVLSLAGVLDYFDSDDKLEIKGHRWERQISLEKFESKYFATWCDEKPEGAHHVAITRKERSPQKVPQRIAADGKKYTYQQFSEFYGAVEKRIAIQKINGGAAGDPKPYSWQEFLDFYGNFHRIKAEESWVLAKPVAPSPDVLKKVEDLWAKADTKCDGKCCPNCGTEIIVSDFCRYTAEVWTTQPKATSAGPNMFPYWPDTQASDCKEIGCIRESSRSGQYFVDISELDTNGKEKGKTYCSTEHGGWDLAQWRALKEGYQTAAKRRPAYGLLCGSITIPSADKEPKRLAADGTAYTQAEFVEYYGKRGNIEWEKAQGSAQSEL